MLSTNAAAKIGQPQSRRARVALLGTRGIPAAYGGFETFAEQLAVRLVQRGHQVTVYSEANQPDLPDEWYQGVCVRPILRPKGGPVSVIAYDCLCLLNARRGHDIVYMLGYGAAWACWWTRKVWGQTVWLNIDGLEWSRSKWSLVARAYLRAMEWVSSWSPTRVIADAQAIADRQASCYPSGVPCTFIAYGAPTVDENAYTPDTLKQWDLQPQGYALVVARPEPENHLLQIVEGYSRFQGHWPLIVVGDIAPRNAYQKHLLSLASNRVRFIGGIYDQHKLTCLRIHAGCHVHGHSVGGTNPSLLEAMACGNVIIAHDNTFNREVARDAATYFRTPEQLTQCLIWAFSLAPDSRQILAARAKEIIGRHYTWEHITDAYEQLLFADMKNTVP